MKRRIWVQKENNVQRSKAVTALLVLLAAALALTGCQSSSGEKDGAVMDKLAVGVVSFADTLETTDLYYSWVVMRYGIGETLVKFSETMAPEPWLAESWEISEDQLTWTFRIRDSVRFSNGTELTAELVKASLERTYDRSKRAETGFFAYESIETEGNDLMITTAAPVPGLPGCLADPLFIIVDTTVDTETYAMDGPICTGAYAVTHFDKEKCVVVKNQYYWDGEVPFEQVTYLAIDDVNTRAMSLMAGETEVAVNIASSDLPVFRENDKFDLHSIASLRTVLAYMNQDGALGDIRVRQAVIRALDRETYANVLLGGTFTAGKAPIPGSLDFGFDQLKDENIYNVESAKALLAEAGWTDSDGDGFVDKNGEKLTLRFVIYDSREELPLLAEATQASLKEIGIDVRIENYEYATLLIMQENGEYDLIISNIITANTGDPEGYLKEFWQSRSAAYDNSNTFGYVNPEVDELLDALSTEFNQEARRELIIRIQQRIMDDAATIFFAYPDTNIISSKKVEGVKMLPADYYWITKDVKAANHV